MIKLSLKIKCLTYEDNLQILLCCSEAHCRKCFDLKLLCWIFQRKLLIYSQVSGAPHSLGPGLVPDGCYVDQICVAVMMVINLKHLESSRAEALCRCPALSCCTMGHIVLKGMC